MKKIYYTKPSITDLEIEYVNDAIRNGWGEKCYDYIIKFGDLFKNYLGVKHAIPTSSCTGALHIALTALGVKAGDEVILPDLTWIATAAPITYLGANPVFVDVLPSSWCINPDQIRKAITKKTKAIIVVHLYGNLVEMDEVLAIAKEHNIPVIEDAAEGIGSEYKGKKAGTMGTFATYSFHGTKTVTTGEGGMLVTNDDELYRIAKVLDDHGRDSSVPKQFWCEKVGYKYRMSNLQAACGCAQMERIDELIQEKINIFNMYKKHIEDFNGIVMNPEPKYTKNSYWMPTIVFDKKYNLDRDSLIRKFNENNIDGRVFFYPVSIFPPFKSMEKENPMSYDIYYRAINLPSYFGITEDDVIRVCNVIKDFLKEGNAK